jgi:hypothetical protein
MINLIDPIAPELPEPHKPGAPASAEDIEFWRDVFSVLLPPEPDKEPEQEG